ncbi:MAG TPA: glucodextranase DOMON-like domain-containing protein, partial [Spirochaetota bacterium]
MEKLKYRIRLVIGISMILAIPLSFIFSRFIESGIDSVLHMKVDPRFSGGAEIARFMDPVGDDDGASDYTYPLNGMFDGRGYLDLVRYVVNEPITNAPWSADADFWQVAFTFDKTANADDSIYSFSHPVIHLYIDIDGKAGGSTETLDPRGEKVQFDPEHPWDIMIQIDGHHKYGKLVSFDGSIKEK